ncbi:hypothetical protein EIP91_009976 [Steccherinum ochraceum]|uniref:ATP-dependent RNA helicase n=1 Tax=Steccherinum ochraceum TaxID=92696 RepID=A0A4R0RNB9_9APHY|nr:hypothetical protein EIP91_009976 [Steccherinum ochraceum]
MTSFISRAIRLAAPVSSRTIVQASRSGVVLPRFVTQPLAVRWASTAAAHKVVETEPSRGDADLRAPSTRSSASELEGDAVEHAAIEEDQPEFHTLAGKVNDRTLRALTVSPMQLTTMSPVQAEVLPLLPGLIRPHDPEDPSSSARDLLVKARTGTGKTIAFLVPAIEARLAEIEKFGQDALDKSGLDPRLEKRARRQLARDYAGPVIISPTRELATQIAVEATKLLKHHPDLQVHLLVGGESKRQQMKHWNSSSRDIIVATPGRLRDLLENEPSVAEPISKSKMLVLDEADTLIDIGFRPDVEAIADLMHPTPERQTLLFSATVSKVVRDIARRILAKTHAFVDCVTDDAPPVHAHVPQYSTILPSAADQIPHILRLIAHDQLTNPVNSKILLFFPTTKMTQLFGTIMMEMRKNLPKQTRIYEIHSKRTQEYRSRMSDYFRNDKSGASVLVSSDVSARGVDYPGVTRVIQVGIPGSDEQYVHRVGRTGRGKEKHGRADIVLLPWEQGFLTWQLKDIPMKAYTTSELETELRELATTYDQNRRQMGTARFVPPYLPKLDALGDEIQKFQENVDPDAVKETMASMLGYYVGRSGDLRCQKSVIVAGLKDWTMEACGLPEPPYISEAFLSRIGASDPARALSRIVILDV